LQKHECELQLRPSITIEDIVEQLKSSPNEEVKLDEESPISSQSSESSSSTNESNSDDQISIQEDDKENYIPSNEIRARGMIKNGAITFDPLMGTFNVKDEVGKVFLVNLEPQSCSCKVVGCCHLLAVAISTGI
jgi:hypothetical protein